MLVTAFAAHTAVFGSNVITSRMGVARKIHGLWPLFYDSKTPRMVPMVATLEGFQSTFFLEKNGKREIISLSNIGSRLSPVIWSTTME